MHDIDSVCHPDDGYGAPDWVKGPDFVVKILKSPGMIYNHFFVNLHGNIVGVFIHNGWEGSVIDFDFARAVGLITDQPSEKGRCCRDTLGGKIPVRFLMDNEYFTVEFVVISGIPARIVGGKDLVNVFNKTWIKIRQQKLETRVQIFRAPPEPEKVDEDGGSPPASAIYYKAEKVLAEGKRTVRGNRTYLVQWREQTHGVYVWQDWCNVWDIPKYLINNYYRAKVNNYYRAKRQRYWRH